MRIMLQVFSHYSKSVFLVQILVEKKGLETNEYHVEKISKMTDLLCVCKYLDFTMHRFKGCEKLYLIRHQYQI